MVPLYPQGVLLFNLHIFFKKDGWGTEQMEE